MFDYLYTWIRNIAYYMVLVTALMQIVPADGYKKYIRFFTGMVLILLLMTPVLKLFGMEQNFSEIYKGKEYETQLRKMEDSTKYLGDIDIAGYFPEELNTIEGEEGNKEGENAVEIGEVQIGR